jgi:hypothetical protein
MSVGLLRFDQENRRRIQRYHLHDARDGNHQSPSLRAFARQLLDLNSQTAA